MIKEEDPNKSQKILKSTLSIRQDDFDFRQTSLNFLQKIMKLQSPPTFDLETLKKDPFMRKNKEFYFFFTILQNWNTKITQGMVTYYERTNFEMNNFIYFYLKSILLHDEPVKTINLSKLYHWYASITNPRPKFNQLMQKIQNKKNRNSSSKQYFREIQDIRKSFISSLPFNINSFNRKLLYPKPILFKESPKHNDSINNCEKNLTDKLFYSGQKKLREIQEQREIQGLISDYKINKSRWKQEKINSKFFLQRILTQKPCQSNYDQFSSQVIKETDITRLSTKQLSILNTQKSPRPLGKKAKQLSKILRNNVKNDIDSKYQNPFTTIDGITLMKNPFDEHYHKSPLKKIQ